MYLTVLAQVDIAGGVNSGAAAIVGMVASLALIVAIAVVAVAVRSVMGGRLSAALTAVVGGAVIVYLMTNPAKVVAFGGSVLGLFGI